MALPKRITKDDNRNLALRPQTKVTDKAIVAAIMFYYKLALVSAHPPPQRTITFHVWIRTLHLNCPHVVIALRLQNSHPSSSPAQLCSRIASSPAHCSPHSHMAHECDYRDRTISPIAPDSSVHNQSPAVLDHPDVAAWWWSCHPSGCRRWLCR